MGDASYLGLFLGLLLAYVGFRFPKDSLPYQQLVGIIGMFIISGLIGYYW